MHMADALLSPAVGLVFIGASGAGIALSAKKIKEEGDERKIPLMGVLGAFVFAAQMINFSIPGTGSSGHLGGGMLLTMLLGPYAAFLTIASVLIVQALFFADGGILALGTNIWNLGFYPCAVGWILYKLISGTRPTYSRVSLAAVLGTIVTLEMGALSVVVQTLLSGKSELPFETFSMLMLGIHLPIAFVEGLITVAVVNFIYRVRSEIVKSTLGLDEGFAGGKRSYWPAFSVLLAAALVTGSVIAWFASTRPDGLEWTIGRIVGSHELTSSGGGITGYLSKLQERTALLPDYGFKEGEAPETAAPAPGGEEEPEAWPDISAGTSVAGVVGSTLVLCLAALTGFGLVRLRKGKRPV